MVLDNEATALTRSWCLFEVLTTLELTEAGSPGFAGMQFCTASGVLNMGHASLEVAIVLAERISQLKLEDATASLESDKRAIDSRVEAKPGGFPAVNEFVRDSIRSALLATRAAVEEDVQQLLA